MSTGGGGITPYHTGLDLTTRRTGTRQRAPLGNKTTNAKARAGPATGGVKDKGKDIEQSQTKPTTIQKQRLKPAAPVPIKLDVRSDQKEAGEPEIEYIPPRPKDLPYESDVFPDDLLTFDGLKPENLLRGYYERYHDPVDENGVRLKDKKFEERLQKALKEGDERILKDIENTDWSISDIPEAKPVSKEPQRKPALSTATRTRRVVSRAPPTLASRRATSALSMPSTVKEKRPQAPIQPRKPRSFLTGRIASRPAPPTKSQPDSVVGKAASRSTLGYSKGRSASSALQTKRTFTRAASAASVTSENSDLTVTPANFHKTQDARPQFLSIFDAGEDSDDDGFGKKPDIDLDDDEDFQLKLDD